MPGLKRPIHNWEIKRGVTFRKGLVYVDSKKRPKDLTGCTAAMHVRGAAGNLVIALTTENSRIVLNDKTGEIDLWISDTITGGLPIGVCDYNFLLLSAGGTRRDELWSGMITIRESSTR